jgi:hypothetical protein
MPIPAAPNAGVLVSLCHCVSLSCCLPSTSGPSLKLADSSSTAWSLSCRSRGWPDAGPGAPAPEPACSCTRDRRGRSAPGPLAVLLPHTRRSVGAIDTPARLARPGPAGAGADGHPRHRRIDDPPAHNSEVLLQAESRGEAEGKQQSFPEGEGGGQDRPAGGGRWRRSVRVPSGQSGGWKRRPSRSVAEARNGEAPPADLACSVARAGGSEGGARCAARATRPRPAGQR